MNADMQSTLQETPTERKIVRLVLNEEQQLLKESARDFLKEKSPVAALRHLRDTQDPKGYSPKLWQEMAEMGWLGLTIPEVYGGMEYGFLGLGILIEEMGRTLTASPLNATVLVGATLLLKGGNETQKAHFLPKIAQGEMLLTLALEEGKHHQPTHIQTTARQEGAHWILDGQKSFVPDGHIADYLLVVARTSGQNPAPAGLSLFLVPRQSEGLQTERLSMVDSRNYAHVHLHQVKVEAAHLLGHVDEASRFLETSLDIARIGLSAEMLGLMQEAFDRTLAYLKERKQFGVPIGSFQGLQHRAADMYCHIELCKSVVLKALTAIDHQDPKLALYASLAKAKCNETLHRVSNEAVQMFGGIGVTDDEEIGFFLKRARALEQSLGDYHFHIQRFAALQGF
ncbi:MAG: acyl-CoA dehydrogenase family protein [Microscillaceae bacterium]